MEMKMEEEILHLTTRIVGKKLNGNANGNGHANGDANANANAEANGNANGNGLLARQCHTGDEYLSGEYEIDTSRLDPQVTAMMAAEYVMDVMRQNGVWLQIGAGRKASQ